jgi:hypothetical protein
MNSTSTESDKALRRREQEASRRLAQIAAEGDPGRSLPRDEAQAARDALIVRAQEARSVRETARAELANRDAEKQSYFARMVSSLAQDKRRKENTPTAAEAERVAFLAELKREQDEKERGRAAT